MEVDLIGSVEVDLIGSEEDMMQCTKVTAVIPDSTDPTGDTKRKPKCVPKQIMGLVLTTRMA